MLAIVTGMIGTYPLGGVAWDYGQYLLGLRGLGFDVVYLEDTGVRAYDPAKGEYGTDSAYGAAFLSDVLTMLGGDQPIPWHFRGPDDGRHGLEEKDAIALAADADVLLNVSGSLLLRPSWLRSRRKVLIDTDPGFTQLANFPRWDLGGGYPGVASYRGHDVFLTYAEAIGTAGCDLPDLGLTWHPTRPPVVLDAWRPTAVADAWTTVMAWKPHLPRLERPGVTYSTKEGELLAIADLPRRVRARLEIAVDGTDVPRDYLREHGWSIVPAAPISVTPDAYRDYVQRSRGEFSVAKNVYVATGSGWFSCRSVCYLASGRPVVLQDTGYSAIIPAGDGLLAWRDIDDARTALERVEADYESHSQAAREMAEEYFAAERVIGDILDRTGIG